MGSALGFSLNQPWGIAMLIFTALGAGMAAPYVMLSAFPRLLRFLPKPGVWMQTLKQVMGFLLLATVVWLAWVLSAQTGGAGVVIMLAVLLLLAAGSWILGRWGSVAMRPGVRRTALSVFVLVLIAGLGLGVVAVGYAGAVPAAKTTTQGSLAWETYTSERYNELRQTGKAVFIDFTAAWCLSCQINERVAFSSEEVQRRFRELDITALKADWTSRDAAITEALARYGRNSVPLYVLYNTGGAVEPIILPELLTPGIVLEALANLDKNTQSQQ